MNLYMGLMIRIAAYVCLTQLNREKKGLESIEAVLLARYIYPFFTYVSENWPAWATIDLEASVWDRLTEMCTRSGGVTQGWGGGTTNPVHSDEVPHEHEHDPETEAMVERLEMLYKKGLMSVETYIAALEQMKIGHCVSETHDLDAEHDLDDLGDDVTAVEHAHEHPEDA